MTQLGQSPAFLEETLEAVPERGLMFDHVHIDTGAIGAQGNAAGQIFLDGHRATRLVGGQIDDAEAAGTQHFIDAVVLQFVA